MAKDRIDQYIETMKETLEAMKENIYVKKYIALQELLTSAERLNAAILASEENIPDITPAKERKPRARKQAKKIAINGAEIAGTYTMLSGGPGTYRRVVTAEETKGDRFVTEPAEGTSGD